MSQFMSPTVNGRWTLAFVSSSAGRCQTESACRWPWAKVRKVNLASQEPIQQLSNNFARRILPNIQQMNRSKPAHAVTRGFPRSGLAYSSESPGCAHRRESSQSSQSLGELVLRRGCHDEDLSIVPQQILLAPHCTVREGS